MILTMQLFFIWLPKCYVTRAEARVYY